MTTPPMNPTLQAARPFEAAAPVRPFAAPIVNQWAPVAMRAEPQAPPGPPAAPPGPANGNNLWNIFNSLWNPNRYKPPAPSLFQNAISNKPTLPGFETVQQRPRPEPMQTRTASATIQYQSNNNAPFQAQTSAYQLGLQNPPSSSIAVPATPVAGTYQGLLDSSNNGLGTSFIVIDGKPYAIRRVINRYSNVFTPGSLNIGRFQPFPRFGPVFMRGEAIPHVVRQALVRYSAPRAPARQKIENPQKWQSSQTPIASPFSRQVNRILSSSPVANKHTAPLSANKKLPTAGAQRFHVTRPNYMQMYSNYVKARKTYNPKPSLAYSRNRNQLNFIGNPPVWAAKKQQTPSGIQPPSLLSPGSKYAVSIKGNPGSQALEAIKYKAAAIPGFLSSILSSRSQLSEQRVSTPVVPRSSNQMKINSFHSLVNLPQTDRALIRAKIIRPTSLRGFLAPKSALPLSPPAKIVYIPQSAYRRLPAWYRPKIGPALVKYTIKTTGQSKAPAVLGTANKKQAMGRPPTYDIWRRIYNFYNKKGTINEKLSQRELGRVRPRLTAVNEPKLMPNTRNQPGVAVGSPIVRVRNFQKLNDLRKSDQQKDNLKINLQSFSQPRPSNAGESYFINRGQTINKNVNKIIPAELWDKRSRIRSFLISKKNTIPHRPSSSGNWGTLRKKRSGKKQ